MTIVTWVFYQGQWYIRWSDRAYTDCGQEHEYGLRKAITDAGMVSALEQVYTSQPESVRQEAIGA